jgi:DhnA family fructose-bisphosphate aldolase class Ia
VGATIGRNIWQAERPARMAAAIASIIHQDATVDEAKAHLF